MSKEKRSAVAAPDKKGAATPATNEIGQTGQTDETGQTGQTSQTDPTIQADQTSQISQTSPSDKKTKAATTKKGPKPAKPSVKPPASAAKAAPKTASPSAASGNSSGNSSGNAFGKPSADDFFASLKSKKKDEAAAEEPSALPYLLGRVIGALGEEESNQLIADIAGFFPKSILQGECVGRSPSSTLSCLAPNLPAGGVVCFSERPRPMPFGFRKLEVPAAFDQGRFFVGLSEAFNEMQKYYPLRAASLYLRILSRIWVGLVEENLLDVLYADDFIREYLRGLQQVDAIASRCQDCAYFDTSAPPLLPN